MFFQFDPTIPVHVPPNDRGFPSGAALAFGLLDYGIEHHVLWGVAYQEGGAVWWVPNPLVRFARNRTAERVIVLPEPGPGAS